MFYMIFCDYNQKITNKRVYGVLLVLSQISKHQLHWKLANC